MLTWVSVAADAGVASVTTAVMVARAVANPAASRASLVLIGGSFAVCAAVVVGWCAAREEGPDTRPPPRVTCGC
ncbi:hypothetical protein GCM10009848_09860 [Micromonospora lupini]